MTSTQSHVTAPTQICNCRTKRGVHRQSCPQSDDRLVTVTAFKCSDGTLIEDSDTADAHQALLDITEDLDSNPLFGINSGARVDPEELIEWIHDHSALVRRILK